MVQHAVRGVSPHARRGKARVMRVVVVGASGNLGTSVLRSLSMEPRVESVLGVARRLPNLKVEKVEWAAADVVTDDLVPLLRGADAVVCLAWIIQPSRDLTKQWMTNVEGTMRVAHATKEAGVPAFLYASSIGAYSPGPKDRAVDESYPTGGLPTVLANPSLINLIPDIENLRSQVIHSYDVGEAFRLAILDENARGAFNIATEPVLDAQEIGRILNARPVPFSAQLARVGAGLSWALRLQPVPPGWLDLSLNVPIMDTTRARTELGWVPARSADEALLELLEGLRTGSGLDTPPLSPKTSGPVRVREILTGVGGREP